jgi:hypothetical protein
MAKDSGPSLGSFPWHMLLGFVMGWLLPAELLMPIFLGFVAFTCVFGIWSMFAGVRLDELLEVLDDEGRGERKRRRALAGCQTLSRNRRKPRTRWGPTTRGSCGPRAVLMLAAEGDV